MTRKEPDWKVVLHHLEKQVVPVVRAFTAGRGDREDYSHVVTTMLRALEAAGIAVAGDLGIEMDNVLRNALKDDPSRVRVIVSVKPLGGD